MADMTMIAALNLALKEEMERDKNVFCIGEDIAVMGGTFGVTRELNQMYPGRVIDTPLCEAGPASMCVGAALYGRRPVMEIMFADFITLTYDAIVNQASKMRYMANGRTACPVVFRGPQGVGGGIGAHHSQTVDSWFMNVPGLKIVTPSTPADAYGLLKASIRDDNPVVFLEHKSLYRLPGPMEPGEPIQLGKAHVARTGQHITVVANQLLFLQISKLAAELEKEGISIELIDPRTLKPFDYETVQNSVRKTGRLLLVSEGCFTGNWTADVASNVMENCFDDLKAPIKRLGAVDSPIPYAKAELMMIPSMDQVAGTIRSMVK